MKRVHDHIRQLVPACVVLLAAASAFVAIRQSLTVVPLLDYAYLVENAYRISQGEMPYRDFFLVLTPGTYLVAALLMRLTGGYTHLSQLGLTVTVAVGSVILTYDSVRRFVRSPGTRLAFLLPLLFTGHALYPFPLYDIWCVAAILLHLSVWFRITERQRHWIWHVLSGVLATLPFYMKQNTGGAYLAGFSLIMLLSCLWSRRKSDVTALAAFVAGAAVSLGVFVFWLYSQQAWAAFVYQAFVFPRSIKQPERELVTILKQYGSYADTVRRAWAPLLSLGAGLLLAELFSRLGSGSRYRLVRVLPALLSGVVTVLLAGFLLWAGERVDSRELYPMAVLWVYATTFLIAAGSMVFRWRRELRVPHTAWHLLPLPLLLTANVTYLSHHIVGSSYGLWPLWAILAAWSAGTIHRLFPRWHLTAAIWIICVFITGIVGRAWVTKEALGYVRQDGPPASAAHPRLAGLAVPGTWLPELTDLIAYTEAAIPREDAVAFVPGEDPFFALTGRRNPLPFVQLQLGTYPVVYELLARQIHDSGAEWLIVKTDWQLQPYLGLVDLTAEWSLLPWYYEQVHELKSYRIYRRREPN